MADLEGRTLGPYHILAEIGHGGMSNVYRASQPSVGREVAIKVLPVHFLQDRTFLERFNREIRVIARLQHPRILPVYDSGEEQGIPYIVMAYVPGGTLAERIKANPDGMALDEVVRMTRQIAEGLDYAHEQGIIHRDLKPSNILIDGKDNIYLADFGIARVLTDAGQSTGSGVVGTPHYMAPEVSYGHTPTARVDIYALGVTLFEMLTGQRPYEGDTPISIILAHTTQPIPNPCRVRPRLPGAVQQVVAWALAKDPADRPGSAGEVAELLERAASIGGRETTPSGGTGTAAAEDDAPRPYVRLSKPVLVASDPDPDPATTDIDQTTPLDINLAALRKPAAPTIHGRRITPGVSLITAGLMIAATAVIGLIVIGLTGGNSPAAAQMGPATARRIAHNADWQPVARSMDGVEMVEVPPGCFMMGNDSGDNERPSREQCFDQAFWIDQTEVTNAQFARLNGLAGTLSRWTNDQQPRERISWIEAAAFCQKRAARLPTEAEWEYAARGPDSLIYPWGNSFDAERVVYAQNSSGESAPVGSRTGGASWVGALDMSGNVYEWTSSLFWPYPYNARDGRENPFDQTHTRVARGGSWLIGARAVLTASLRSGGDPASYRDDFGFRCARQG